MEGEKDGGRRCKMEVLRGFRTGLWVNVRLRVLEKEATCLASTSWTLLMMKRKKFKTEGGNGV